MATRQEFLARVRREVGRASASFAATVSTRPAHAAAEATVIRRQLAERWPSALARFQEEFERVGGVFHRAATAAAVSGLVASIARDRTARSIVTWGSDMLGLDLRRGLLAAGELDVAVVPPGAGEEARQEHRAVVASADLGVTGADVALAETGTIVLCSGPGRPRSTSLLPATHVALFDRHRLVESLEQMGVILEALSADAGAPDGAVVNFITGPSRTADIELTLTRGVHGPRFVHAVFVEDAAGLDARPPWGWP